MKKVIKRLLVLLALVITSVGLIACNEKPTPQPEPIVETEQFTVTFDTLGGSEIPSVKVDKDSKLTKPANPTKAGHEFSFWFLEEGFGFSNSTSNIT